MNAQFQSDKTAYRAACDHYYSLCHRSSMSRAASIELRAERFAAFAAKREAAENLLMNVSARYAESLRTLGLYDLYSELTAGTENPSLLFRIADATMPLEIYA